MPRAPKKCGRQGCTERVTGSAYCPIHKAEQQARANTATRGYDHNHRKMAEQARANLVDGTPCSRCRQPMHHGQLLDLDHTDDRGGYLGLSHRRCNVRAGVAAHR